MRSYGPFTPQTSWERVPVPETQQAGGDRPPFSGFGSLQPPSSREWAKTSRKGGRTGLRLEAQVGALRGPGVRPGEGLLTAQVWGAPVMQPVV